jgi:DNA-binding transcriptional regulator YbjK
MTTAARHSPSPKNLVRGRNVSLERSSRRNLIAGAVIELLAREGGRGVTHGKIDALLRLPKGSTSFYFRRRSELFEAGVRKLVTEDLEDLHTVLGALFAAQRGNLSVQEVARCQYTLWRQATRPGMRTRAIARFEFFLHAVRDPRFGRFHAEVRKAIFDFGAMMFMRMGAKNPRSAALEFGYLVRGDSMAYWFLPPAVGGHEVTAAYYEQRLQEIIDATNRLPADTHTLPKRERVRT